MNETPLQMATLLTRVRSLTQTWMFGTYSNMANLGLVMFLH